MGKNIRRKSQQSERRSTRNSIYSTSTAKNTENNALQRALGDLVKAHCSATSGAVTEDPNLSRNANSRNDRRKSAAASRSPMDDGDRSLDDETEVELGKRYMVRRYGESWEPADILETRIINQKREYYARFEGLDCRLDQWVKRDRIMNSTLDTDFLELSIGTITRSQKRRLSTMVHHKVPLSDMNQDTDLLEKESKKITNVKYITKIHFGQYEIGTWYYSPFPAEYEKEDKIWMCEYCLKYCKLEKSYRYHLQSCKWKQPIGVKIYYKEPLSIYEVNPSESSEHKLYCQNLCLLSKLFLEHKYIHYDVESFLFYILCRVDYHGTQLIGYFSKEKSTDSENNVACILVLPQFQKQGYGKLLIAFSYELSKLEGIIAGPETPFSDFAKIAYKSYWSWVLLEVLKNTKGLLSIRDLSVKTSITQADIVSTLQSMNLVNEQINERVIYVTPTIIEQLVNSGKYKCPKFIIDRNAIEWTPMREKFRSRTKSVVNIKAGTPKRSRRATSCS